MKPIAALTCMLLISIATPAFALQGSDCSARSAQLKPAEREGFMKSCLDKADDPANVQEEERKQKNARCEQNAKNKKLQGNDKATYLSSCMNKNEAAVAATAQPKNVIASGSKSAASSSPKAAPHKEAKKQKSAKKQKGRKKEAGKDAQPSGNAAAK